MYERFSIPAIQFSRVKDFDTRFRRFNSISERNRTFELMRKIDEVDASISKVTLSITAETLAEQQALEL